MNNPKTEEIVATLREYAPDEDGTQRYILIPAAGRGAIAEYPVTPAAGRGAIAEYPVTVIAHRTDIMRDAADLIEELQRELEDERYRHDRYADYCVAADEERSALKERARWIPVEERLPEDEGEKFIKYGFVHDGELDDRRFMSAGCYYLHDTVPHWRNEGYAGMKVTHWMDPPPEE